ncbi:MAG: MBOAT family protein [Blastocatellia bacterium]|nr:MBOAT family protein [Blastocatellia bacterium]
MFLTSGVYFIFLLTVFFAYWLITKPSGRVTFLAGASCFFYACAGVKPLLLLLAMALVDFTTTRLMAQTESERKRKFLLAISLVTDIGTLCFFKYANFFLATVAEGANRLGFPITVHPFRFLVPLGISFFVFQSLAYVIDVYRKDTEAVPNFIEYFGFVTFFPTIVAGPILRARQLLPQLRQSTVLTPEMGGQALFLIAVGLTKKFAIADYLSTNFVERVFDFPERFSSLEVLVAVYGYALQIYADFSGYSDIAIGSAMLLGLTLPLNFNAPYVSRDLPEFWRRWHISLSTWLRDYVFFTIAGRRMRNQILLYAGLVITMLVGGLWHGATWTFVFWGLLHGIGLALYRGFDALRAKPANLVTRLLTRKPTFWSKTTGVLATFHFVCLTWVFFRSETISQAFGLLRQIGRGSTDTSNLTLPVLLVILLGFAAHWLPENWWNSLGRRFVTLPALGQAAMLFALAVGLYYVASSDVAPFIYAKF